MTRITKISQPRAGSALSTPLGDTEPFTPTADQPVKIRSRQLPADTHFDPHRHAWAQVAYCSSGVAQVMVLEPKEVNYIIPPSRAVWIPPNVLHNILLLEDAQMRTLYVHQSTVGDEAKNSRMFVVSPLLRELVQDMGQPTTQVREERRHAITQLILDEIRTADTQLMGVALPQDKRLRTLCDAMLKDPAKRTTLAEWAAEVGASERTIARLFREELDLSYQQWRQQAVLAKALPMLARSMPVSQVAMATGYATDSAFSAMFKAAMGQSPSQFQNPRIARARTAGQASPGGEAP